MSLLDRLFRREGGDDKDPEAAPDPTRPSSISARLSEPNGRRAADHLAHTPEPVEITGVRPPPAARPTIPPASPPARSPAPTRNAAPLAVARAFTPRKRQGREESGTQAIASLIEKAVDELGDPQIERALDDLVEHAQPTAESASRKSVREGVSTAVDLAAVQATYQELAVEYCAPVRNVMIEVGRGEPPSGVLDFVRPAIQWLHSTALQMDLEDLATALEGFGKALGLASRVGQATICGEVKRALQRAYAPLVQQLPLAFDIEGERERREHIILRSLLLLVPGIDSMMVDRMLAAGLNTLQTLARARADEVAAVAGIPMPLATRVVNALRAERGAAGVSLASADIAEEKKRLQLLVNTLAAEHEAFEKACKGWTEAHREEKRRFRGQRELTFLRIKVSLARLGDLDRIVRLERLPFASKIQELESQFRLWAASGPARGSGGSALRSRGEPLSQRDH
jgi:hypothetical protein